MQTFRVFAWMLFGACLAPGQDGSTAALEQRGYRERVVPEKTEVIAPSAADRARGWMLFRRDRNRELFPHSRPAPGEELTRVVLTATAGEMESEPFAVHALRDSDLPPPRIQGLPFLKVENVVFHPVQYPTADTRGRDEVRAETAKEFVRYPVFLRPAAAQRIPAGESRMYWVTATLPDDIAPGTYTARLHLAGVDLPISVRVLPFKLTTEGLPRFGAFFSGAKMARAEWRLAKRYGLDAAQWFWNANRIEVRNDNGAVALDFTAYDAAVEAMQEAGMRGPLVLSLGNSWLGHYEMALAAAFDLKLLKQQINGQSVTLMDMTDPRWEKLYVEGLRLIFRHAREKRWPPLALLINDEPTKYIMAYHPYRYHLVKKHFPEVPVYGVFFEPEKDPGPLLHSSDIVVANRDLDRMSTLASQFGKRFWSYNNVTADESFGKIRLLYGQIPAYYGSEVMWFWSWNYYVGNAWDDFDGRGQSDADWVAVYPSLDGVEPVRTLALEAAREAIDDVRYLKTLEQKWSRADPARWKALREQIRARQKAMFDGIHLDARINSDADFFTAARPTDPEHLRTLVIQEMLR